jgi:hypothetical protein
MSPCLCSPAMSALRLRMGVLLAPLSGYIQHLVLPYHSPSVCMSTKMSLQGHEIYDVMNGLTVNGCSVKHQ